MSNSKRTTQQQFARSEKRRNDFFNDYFNGNKKDAAKKLKQFTKYETFQLAMDIPNRFEPDTLDCSQCFAFTQNVLTGEIHND